MPVISLPMWFAERKDGSIVLTSWFKQKDRIPEFATGVKRDAEKDANGRITSPELFEHRFVVLPKNKVTLNPSVGGWSTTVTTKGRVSYALCLSEKQRDLFEVPAIVDDDVDNTNNTDNVDTDADADVDDDELIQVSDLEGDGEGSDGEDEGVEDEDVDNAVPTPQAPPQLLQQSLEELHLLFGTQPPAKTKRTETQP